ESSDVTSLSWQNGLLLPSWVRRTSSPISNIGVPAASSVTVKKFLTCRLRNASTAGSAVGPSTPQFQLMLSLEPSRLFSPLGSLCLPLYETRSLRVNPS